MTGGRAAGRLQQDGRDEADAVQAPRSGAFGAVCVRARRSVRVCNRIADIVLRVYDACPPGRGRILVRSDERFDIRTRIELSQSMISGRCLEYDIVAYSIPPGETRTVYVADYFHAGNPADHWGLHANHLDRLVRRPAWPRDRGL